MGVVLSLELELIPNQVRVSVYTLGLGVRVRVQEGLAPRVKVYNKDQCCGSRLRRVNT